MKNPLHWRHNGRDGVSNHQPHDCLLNRLFGRRLNKTWKLRVTGLCEGNSLVTGEFPAQMASNAENVSIWWRNHGTILPINLFLQLHVTSFMKSVQISSMQIPKINVMFIKWCGVDDKIFWWLMKKYILTDSWLNGILSARSITSTCNRWVQQPRVIDGQEPILMDNFSRASLIMRKSKTKQSECKYSSTYPMYDVYSECYWPKRAKWLYENIV